MLLNNSGPAQHAPQYRNRALLTSGVDYKTMEEIDQAMKTVDEILSSMRVPAGK
jgi:hypothetical protein